MDRGQENTLDISKSQDNFSRSEFLEIVDSGALVYLGTIIFFIALINKKIKRKLNQPRG